MNEKNYISSRDLLSDSFKLGAMVIKSGFRPNVIIALWRGGAPIGIAVQEFLDYFGIKTDHISIRTSSYNSNHERSDNIRVHGLNYLIKNIEADDDLLIVDDVFDTGITIRTLIAQIREKARANCPADIRVAVPWFKPAHNRTDRVPDYYIHTTDKWLKYPFSLEGLSVDEIRENRADIYKIIAPALKSE